jgi:hypothetical protein
MRVEPMNAATKVVSDELKVPKANDFATCQTFTVGSDGDHR